MLRRHLGIWALLVALSGPASALAQLAEPAAAPTPADYLDRAIALLRRQHINSGKIDWPVVTAEAHRRAASATTTAETYPAIRYVIGELKERHTMLLPPEYYARQQAGQNAQSGEAMPLTSPTGFRLDGGAGYVAIPPHTGALPRQKAYAEAGRKVVADLDHAGVCGWVVDLRSNGGGAMWPMVNTLAGILGEPPYGAFVFPGAGGRAAWTLKDGEVVNERGPPLYGLPAQAPLKAAMAPMAVLVGPGTGSSGEFTAMAIRGRPHTRLFGQPTAGLITGNSTIRLPDGAALVISGSWGEDRTGFRDAERIVPDIDAETSQGAVDAALAWLKTEGCG